MPDKKAQKEPVRVHPSPPSLIPKGSTPLQLVEAASKAALDPTGWRRRLFDRASADHVLPGDVVKVVFKDSGRREFQGTVMAIRRRGIDTSVRLRSVVAALGVEMSVKVFSSGVDAVEFVARADKKARRAKLYYLRDV